MNKKVIIYLSDLRCIITVYRSAWMCNVQNLQIHARRRRPPLSSMASVSVPVSVNEDQAKAMAKKVGVAALDAGKKAPCP